MKARNLKVIHPFQSRDCHLFYIRFLMKNLIRSKEEQIRKQEAEIARKTHEIASLEQSFSQRPIDSTISNSLYKVSFAGRPYTRKLSSWMNAVLQQHAYLEILKKRDVQPFSLIMYFSYTFVFT